MKRSPQTPDLREAGCPSCGKLLGRLRLEDSSVVELKCRHCSRGTTFLAAPSPASSRE